MKNFIKHFKRLLLRPFYAFYWLKFKVKEYFNIENRFEIRVHQDTLGDWTEKIGLRNFNSWLSKHGYWRLSTQMDNLKLIVPKSYRDLIIKYPELKNPFKLVKEMTKPEYRPTGNKVFYHYEDGEVKTSDKAGPPVTVTIKTPPEDPTDW